MMKLIKPMLADKKEPFDDPDFMFEVKWDGVRALAYLDKGLHIINRRDIDITYRYPELHNLAKFIKAKNVVLDGEIIVLRDGLPSFNDLQKRDHLQDEMEISIRKDIYPAIYVVFDVLSVDGESLISKPLIERKKIIQRIVKENDNLMISTYVMGKGKRLFEEVTKKGIEGVMAKRADGKYYPGGRGCGGWFKIKKIDTVECVICGYKEGTGERKDRFGSVILGMYKKGELVEVGKAGSGFQAKELTRTFEIMQKLITNKCPFKIDPRIKGVTWIEPKLVGEVSFMEWSDNKKLRFPRWITQREDKKPKECVML